MSRTEPVCMKISEWLAREEEKRAKKNKIKKAKYLALLQFIMFKEHKKNLEEVEMTNQRNGQSNTRLHMERAWLVEPGKAKAGWGWEYCLEIHLEGHTREGKQLFMYRV